MKRTLTKGILSAVMLANCLLAARGQQVYSQNICPFFNVPKTNITDVVSPILGVGPFNVGEHQYWTDTYGNRLHGPHRASDPVGSSTYFMVGTPSITVPFSAKRIAIIGEMTLVLICAVSCSVLLKRYSKRRDEISN
jgi:hypothetical protein